MRSALSACFALVLLAGNTGCCLFCRPLFPCLHRNQCNECSGMGCERAPIFNWSRCCDTCDHCGDWSGQSIIARTGSSQAEYMSAARSRNNMNGNRMASRTRSMNGSDRVVPGTYREVTRVQEQNDEVAEVQVVDEEPVVVAEAPRVKRVRSSKPRTRSQVVRVRRDEYEDSDN
ncbi:MAG TPA: hypothetical protein VHC22_04415 [Pirellulales bacterium]|nr:hypothetical protein [Pirellulales bacterium]